MALQDTATKIEYLKRGRRFPLPDRARLWADWQPTLHEIVADRKKYPQIEVVKSPEKTTYDPDTGKSIHVPKETEKVEPNRIAIPLEQNICNIHTAFTVGNEPKMSCDPDDSERNLLDAIYQVLKSNKTRYQNRRIVRSWLSETECAEYWYTVEDNGFWNKMRHKVGSSFGNVTPSRRLRSTLWSPFRGDKLYPFFNDNGDLVAFSREYSRTEVDGITKYYFMTITSTRVHKWVLDGQWKEEEAFNHGFGKLPVIYAHRREALCDKVRTLRVRLEKLLSEYADCIDYHFFPILLLYCDDIPNLSGDMRNRIMQLTGDGANASYLTWNQVPETVKYEVEQLLAQAYSMTDTPRISFDYLIGRGNAVSGEAFKYVFMSVLMAVENHAEVMGDFFQRRVNFIVSALGSISPIFAQSARTIDIDVSIQPYTIDNIAQKVQTAVAAVSGGVWSRRTGVMFCGNIERTEEELEEIKAEMAEKQPAEVNRDKENQVTEKQEKEQEQNKT